MGDALRQWVKGSNDSFYKAVASEIIVSFSKSANNEEGVLDLTDFPLGEAAWPSADILKELPNLKAIKLPKSLVMAGIPQELAEMSSSRNREGKPHLEVLFEDAELMSEDKIVRVVLGVGSLGTGFTNYIRLRGELEIPTISGDLSQEPPSDSLTIVGERLTAALNGIIESGRVFNNRLADSIRSVADALGNIELSNPILTTRAQETAPEKAPRTRTPEEIEEREKVHREVSARLREKIPGFNSL